MKIYIDADAFPNLLKPVVERVIERLKIETYVIANKRVNMGNSRYLNSEIVSDGPDVADDRIVELAQEGDLVMTADIPLADRVVTKGCYAIDFRGEEFHEGNIKEILSTRDFMQELRDSGVMTSGPSAFSKRDVQDFNNQLDRLLTRILKK